MLSIDKSWYEAVAQASEYVTLMDANDRLLYVNHAQEGLESYLGRPVYEFVDPAFHELLKQSVKTARETKLPQHFVSNAVGPNGQQSTYSSWVFPVLIEQAQDVVAFVATDVTHQDRVEAELELSQLTFQSLVQNSPDLILVVDRERKILFVNRIEKGFSKEAIIGMPAESFVFESDRQMVIDTIDQVIRTGEATQHDTTMETPEGEVLHFTTRSSPIFIDGKIDRVMLVATDITERLSAERERESLASELQQAQKMESLGKLTGGVAHDFNNLLTAISSYCELAKNLPGIQSQAVSYLEHSLEAVRLGKSLTQRLLAFSRKQYLRSEIVDVNTLMLGFLEMLQRTLGETIRVEAAIAEEGWACQVDPGQLENAILNLAVNARDAMPAGGSLLISCENVSLESDLEPDQEPGDFVRIRIQDSGEGMSADVAARAIEPFFTTKDVGEGSGLGLSMVYGFVRQSNGNLRIDSQPGLGTTVEITLPRVHERPRTIPRPKMLGDLATGNGELILVVEDDSLVRSSVEAILNGLGYRTVTAGDSLQALEVLGKRDDISLVLSDVVLTGRMNGFELAAKAREDKPDLKVIFVSGYPDSELNVSANTVNVPILEKPYTMEQLAQAIRQTLRTHPQQVSDAQSEIER